MDQGDEEVAECVPVCDYRGVAPQLHQAAVLSAVRLAEVEALAKKGPRGASFCVF